MNAPVLIPANEISFEQYFAMLKLLLPGAEGFFVQDTADQVLAQSALEADKNPHTGPASLDSGIKSSRVSRVSNDFGGRMYAVNLQTFTGELWGQLFAMMPQQNGLAESTVADVLDAVGQLIDHEYKLAAELDAMAEELTDRYEELNLVYDNVHELLEVQSQGDAINHIVEHCVEHLGVGIVALVFEDSDNVYYATNEAFATRPYALIKRYADGLIKGVQQFDASVIINKADDPLITKLGIDSEYKVLAAPVTAKRGRVTAALVCITDVGDSDFMNSDRNLLEVMAKRIGKVIQANRDDLTGLMNLRILDVVLRRALQTAREEGVFHSFLNINLQQVKIINENHGREVGDTAIEFVGAKLASMLRATDNIGYLGQGQYGVLLERCNMEQGLKVAESLSERIEQCDFQVAGQRLPLSISVGATLIEPHSKNVDDILEAAEMAQETAKKKGQSRIQAYLHDDEDLNLKRSELRWVNRIQTALETEQFNLHCQSIVPSKPGAEEFHFEVLLRLLDENGEIVSPALFIPPAEKFSLMPSIDRWVVNKSLTMLSKSGLLTHGSEGLISINLSGQSLDDPGLVDHVDEVLRRTQVPPENVCFEITETAAFSHVEVARKLLEGLKALGCVLSLDDFGTGLSSFSYLKTLPVDILKIDGSFVANILEDPVSEAMVHSINEIGHVMNLRTVAEFVESDAIADHLRSMGIDYLQGYGLGKPQPMDTYLKLLVETKPNER